MKKTIITILLVLAMVLVGCSGGSKTPTEKSRSTSSGKADNSLSLAITTVTTTMDPQNFALNVESSVIAQMYEPLFLFDNDGNLESLLIEGMDVAEDDSSVTFTLKSDVKFHSGDTLEAEDVKYTFERGVVSGVVGVLNQYSTCEVIDEKTVKFSFPYASLGAGFSAVYSYFEHMYIVNASYCESLLAQPTDNLYYNVDGTGAYQFSKVDVNGDITITRFADYHGEASIDTIYFKLITGDTKLAFESGDIDGTGVTPAEAAAYAEYTNISLDSIVANYVAFTTLNISADSKLHDLGVRQAVAYAMNRDDIATVASGGAGTTAYNLANPLVTYYADCCNHYDRDVEKSKQLLSEAGYSETNKLELTLITMAAQSDWVDAAQIIKENLEDSYITVTIVEVPDTTRYFTLDFDLGFIGVGLTTAFSSFSMLFDDNSLNLCGITGDEQTEIMNKFAAAVDEATTHEAMAAVVDTLGYIPCYYTISYIAYDSDLSFGQIYNETSGNYYRNFSWNK